MPEDALCSTHHVLYCLVRSGIPKLAAHNSIRKVLQLIRARVGRVDADAITEGSPP
eukprot:CAMPEP_0197458934 /NCGR_PEP_ID=MMETSP1175-20131217/50003_1 /TAXON_ID=1003142 /ORGANISM="Triceratium dubium, Strain CCMP147" /LENGTH=55 /DNA_ID=CAMNT_0042993681 /DNA_START=36 /DNA_END=200 /DNA_ORIENTATION=-